MNKFALSLLSFAWLVPFSSQSTKVSGTKEVASFSDQDNGMSHPVSPPPAILSGCSNPGARLETCTASPFNAGQFANWCKNSEGVCDVGQSVSLSDDGNIEKAPLDTCTVHTSFNAGEFANWCKVPDESVSGVTSGEYRGVTPEGLDFTFTGDRNGDQLLDGRLETSEYILANLKIISITGLEN